MRASLVTFLMSGLMAAHLAHAALPFATAPVAYRDVDETYAVDALVEAVKQSTVAAQISGRIVDVRFDVGDTVRKGQVIARIDQREVVHALSESRAQAAQAQAVLQNAKNNYERTRQLYEQKFVSRAALDKALAEYEAAKAQAAAARAGVGIAATREDFSTITSPYTGVVSERHVEIGEMATPGSPLMTGFDPKDLRVVASVPQYKINEVRRATHGYVEMPALKRTVEAERITVLPAADPRTHTARVRLDLPANTAGVIPGMSARAHFVIGKRRKLLVPDAAVVRRSEVTAVYVVDAKGRVSLRQVRVGEPGPKGDVEVLSGLAAGERVALEPIKAGIYLKQQASGR